MGISPNYLSILHTKADRNITDFRERIVSGYGLTSPEWQALGLIDAAGDAGTQVGQIAIELDVASTYATALVRKLKEKKLIKQKISAEDKRGRIITITARGHQVVQAIADDIEQEMNKVAQQVSDRSFDHYVKVLEFFAGSQLKG